MTSALPRAVSGLLIAFAIGSGWLSHSDAARAEDLAEVFADAQTADLDYRSEVNAYLAAQYKVPEARAALLPHLTLDALGERNNFEQSGLPNTSYSTNGYSVTLTQPIFRYADLMGYEQSKVELSTAAVDFHRAEQDLIQRVCRAYFDVLDNEDSLRLSEKHEKSIALQLDAATRALEAGNATIVDIAEAKAAYELSQSQQLDAANALEVSLARLSTIVGRPLQPLAALRIDMELPDIKPDRADDWIESARDHNFDVQLAELAVKSAQYDTENARGQYMPTLSLVARHTHGNGEYMSDETSFDLNGRTAHANDIGLQLSIPLFDGFSAHEQVGQKKVLEKKSEIDLERARNSAFLEAQRAFGNLQTALAKVRSLSIAARSAALSLEANRKAYDAGTRISVDVLTAEEKSYSAERDLSSARYGLLMDGLRLKASAAQLGPDDVGKLNALLVH